MDLNIATPSMVLNYTAFLQDHCQLFEESFRVYERALEMFPWPHKFELWIQYLKKMVERFRDKKMERIRDLFLKCLDSLPANRVEEEVFN
mmetsp:Transcript_18187/g.31132  ORF Transcript_18187/g.31132 Transcript_18187/m.31132 type:complete len:90 (+) Transcript_18187:1840-2109(+)